MGPRFQTITVMTALGAVGGMAMSLGACGKDGGSAPPTAAVSMDVAASEPQGDTAALGATVAPAKATPPEPAFVAAPKPPEAATGGEVAPLPGAVDFEKLAAAAFDERGEPRSVDAMAQLWTPVFQLPTWNILLVPSAETLDSNPLVRELNGQAWVFAFTDHAHARAFAEANDLLDAAGNASVMSIPMPGAKGWLEGLQARKIHGVQFNFGAPGWFSPLAQLEPIRAFLVENGYLK